MLLLKCEDLCVTARFVRTRLYLPEEADGDYRAGEEKEKFCVHSVVLGEKSAGYPSAESLFSDALISVQVAGGEKKSKHEDLARAFTFQIFVSQPETPTVRSAGIPIHFRSFGKQLQHILPELEKSTRCGD